MGSLKDVVLQRETVETVGGDFTVGPLTAADILAIYVRYRRDLETMFDSYKGGRSPDEIFADLIGTFPEIGAEIIARGAEGEFDELMLSNARGLDFGAQFVALEKIGELTVASAGGLGNLADLTVRLVRKVNDAMALEGDSLLASGSQTSDNSAPAS